MSARRRRYFGEQFEFEPLQVGKVAPKMNEWDIIAELRARLRKAQAAQFRAEANLAISTVENSKLQARLQRIAEVLKA